MPANRINGPSESSPAGEQEEPLLQTLAECHAVIQAQSVVLRHLQEQVVLLTERVNLNSKNSSKPPSSDGPGGGNRAARRASARKRGAQPGHKGHTRSMLDEREVDRVIDCKPEAVCECGAPVAQAAASLCNAPALWMDKIHYPREGVSNWAWAAVQPLLAVFAIYPSRARYVILDLVGERCTAVVTSDRYAGYAFIDTERRQVCWAHLLRDFNRIAQRQGLAGRAHRPAALRLGLVMFRKREKGQLHGRTLEGLQRRMQAALTRGAEQGHRSRTANTCANVLKLWTALWSFTANAGLAPTNNAAEQALRSLVLKRKISGPTRSLRGDQFLARGFTAHETCLRQGRDLWEFMHQAVHAFIAKTVAPSLMPQAVAEPGVVPSG